MKTTFSAKIKSLRIKARLTLSAFCEKIEWDCSNWSKVERELLPPPSDPLFYKKIALFLGLSEKEEKELFDLAQIQKGLIPKSIAESELVDLLPAFCRAADGGKMKPEAFDRLVEDIRKFHTGE